MSGAANGNGANGNGNGNPKRELDALRQEVNELRERWAVFGTKADQSDVDIATLASAVKAIQDSRQLSWGVVSSVLGSLAIVGALLFWIVNAQMDGKILPLVAEQDTEAARINILNDQVRELTVESHETARAALRDALRIDDADRIQAIIWQKSMATPYPQTPESR